MELAAFVAVVVGLVVDRAGSDWYSHVDSGASGDPVCRSAVMDTAGWFCHPA